MQISGFTVQVSTVCMSYNDLSCCTEQGNTGHRRKQLHRHSVFACLELFQDTQVTQTAALIDPDSRSCVSAKLPWLQLYCISPLGGLKSIISCPRCWQTAGSSISVCRSFVCFWPAKNPADRADGPTLCRFFVSSANPQLLSLYQWLASRLPLEKFFRPETWKCVRSTDLCRDYKNYR